MYGKLIRVTESHVILSTSVQKVFCISLLEPLRNADTGWAATRETLLLVVVNKDELEYEVDQMCEKHGAKRETEV